MLRSEVVAIRLAPAERKMLHDLAQREQLASASEAFRFALRRVAEERGIWPPARRDDEAQQRGEIEQ